MNLNYIENKISIQIPTRNRPLEIIEVINNLLDMVHNVNNIEILLRIDDDDFDTLKSIENTFSDILNTTLKIVIGPRNGGYFDLPKFHYELSEISTGEWIFLYNDDVKMLTKNFDLVISKYKGQIKILQAVGENNGFHNGIAGGNWFFPIINRKIVHSLGHFSVDTPYADGWIRVIGEKLNLHIIIPIELEHSVIIRERMDSTNVDKTLINDTIGKQFDWNFHMNDENGLINKDVLFLKEKLSL